MAAPAAVIADFAAEVGSEGPVAVEGSRTEWSVGGEPAPGTRLVRAPGGVVDHQPGEMIVRVRAGTPVAELEAAVAERGQTAALDPADPRATVGGTLAVGRSGIRRLGWGPVRDSVLEITYVSAEGGVVKAGAPVVKNVTGFDLVRLMVGSLGTLGLLAEVVLRLRPRPQATLWLTAGGVDPFRVRASILRPSSLLWDGERSWVLLEGAASDVAAERLALGSDWQETDGPPPIPSVGRESVDPAGLASLEGSFVAEVGVGIVHRPHPGPRSAPSPAVSRLGSAVKARFDPTGRLNPGRQL